jgi:hypothetical protein
MFMKNLIVTNTLGIQDSVTNTLKSQDCLAYLFLMFILDIRSNYINFKEHVIVFAGPSFTNVLF